MFAKLYETAAGQILVKIDDADDGPEVRIYFEPKGLGVCSFAYTWNDASEDDRWSNAEKLFESIDESRCALLVSDLTHKLMRSSND